MQSRSLPRILEEVRTGALHESRLLVRPADLLFFVLLLLVLLVRASDLNYNTLFVDEAIYVTVGREALSGLFDQAALSWMFGSYLYPVSSGLADIAGGVTGIRLLSTAFSLITAVYVYLTARRLFGDRPALWALIFFGFCGPSISLGQQAVYDAMILPLIAAAVFYMVLAVQVPGRQRIFLTAAGVGFALAVLAKYISLMLLAPLLAVGAALHLREHGSLRALLLGVRWECFALPALVILGPYGLLYHEPLRKVFSGEYSTQAASRGAILLQIAQDIGLVIALAGAGIGLLARREIRRGRTEWLVWATAAGLALTLLVVQIYHLTFANERALWKHNVASLIFLAPPAGFALVYLTERLRALTGPRAQEAQLLAGAIIFAAGMWFISSALDQNWGFHNSYPNIEEPLAYLHTLDITPDDLVIAAAATAYEYYFDFGTLDRSRWFSTWFMEYKGLSGEPALLAAIGDCAADVVVLDDFWTPDLNPVLQPALLEAGYVRVFSSRQRLAGGETIETRIYLPPDRVPAAQRSIDQRSPLGATSTRSMTANTPCSVRSRS